MPQPDRQHNRLIFEQSLYLLQHARNPVDWYPWGPEALEKAKQEDRPIFLSIGYSACHACHVMARESFEDAQVARMLNEAFVCVKVDRQERPDVDLVYRRAAEALGGHSGWPLTIIMTPEQKPFFAATYLAKSGQDGREGMVEVIERIRGLWEKQRNDLLVRADELAASLTRQGAAEADAEVLDETVLKKAYEDLLGRFDTQHGGFGTAPKLPAADNLVFLLRYWKRAKEPTALAMVEKTLQAMSQGGIWDHVGFGFHRYAADAGWSTPHFEKMLCDQALLSFVYIEAYQATQKKEYRRVAEEIFDYCLREMLGPLGAFYCAEDADSEGREGQYYKWSQEQIREHLEADEAEWVIPAYRVLAGTESVLSLEKSIEEIAREDGEDSGKLRRLLENARRKLLKARSERARPQKDDKILADYNGLMIAALAKGAQVFGDVRYLDAARKAVNFILKRLFKMDGRLLHRYRDGQAGVPAYLDDYVFLSWGFIELYAASLDEHDLDQAVALTKKMLELFWDKERRGFYLTGEDAEPLLLRPKIVKDGLTPSGNAVAMINLLRLSRMTKDTHLQEMAGRMQDSFSKEAAWAPSSYARLMSGFDLSLGAAVEVVVVGKAGAEETKAMWQALHVPFLPHAAIIFRDRDEGWKNIGAIAAFIKKQENGPAVHTTAYVCLGGVCKFSTGEAELVIQFLESREGRGKG